MASSIIQHPRRSGRHQPQGTPHGSSNVSVRERRRGLKQTLTLGGQSLAVLVHGPLVCPFGFLKALEVLDRRACRATVRCTEGNCASDGGARPYRSLPLLCTSYPSSFLLLETLNIISLCTPEPPKGPSLSPRSPFPWDQPFPYFSNHQLPVAGSCADPRYIKICWSPVCVLWQPIEVYDPDSNYFLNA